MWLFYIALEPYVRRFWPQTLISWPGLLEERVRDSRLGNDLLLGMFCGCIGFALFPLNIFIPDWLGLRPPKFDVVVPNATLGSTKLIGVLLSAVFFAMFAGLLDLFLMLIPRISLKNKWLAGSAFIAILTILVGLGKESKPYVFWALRTRLHERVGSLPFPTSVISAADGWTARPA